MNFKLNKKNRMITVHIIIIIIIFIIIIIIIIINMNGIISNNLNMRMYSIIN